MGIPEIKQQHAYTDKERYIADGLVEDAYHSLLNIARNRRRKVGFSATMMTEDILHDCFLKLSGKNSWQSHEQFMRTACLAIRQIVVDHARKKLTIKRGEGQQDYRYSDDDGLMQQYNENPEQILSINDLLEQLEIKQPRLAKVVDARYFAGLTEAETAQALGVSERTIRRDWQVAKVWLAEKMEKNSKL